MAARTPTWWDAGLLARWTAVNGLAYAVIVVGGIALEELFSGTARSLAGSSRELAIVAVALLGSTFHGFVLGRWQWRVLRLRLPSLERRRWVVGTFIPALAVWLLVLAPEAVDVITAGGATLLLFRDAFVQAIVLGPLIGLTQAATLHRHTTRWAWWFVANVTTYLFAAVMYELGDFILRTLDSFSRATSAFPLLAFVFHGLWMLWVTDPAVAVRARSGAGRPPGTTRGAVDPG